MKVRITQTMRVISVHNIAEVKHRTGAESATANHIYWAKRHLQTKILGVVCRLGGVQFVEFADTCDTEILSEQEAAK